MKRVNHLHITRHRNCMPFLQSCTSHSKCNLNTTDNAFITHKICFIFILFYVATVPFVRGMCAAHCVSVEWSEPANWWWLNSFAFLATVDIPLSAFQNNNCILFSCECCTGETQGTEEQLIMILIKDRWGISHGTTPNANNYCNYDTLMPLHTLILFGHARKILTQANSQIIYRRQQTLPISLSEIVRGSFNHFTHQHVRVIKQHLHISSRAVCTNYAVWANF